MFDKFNIPKKHIKFGISFLLFAILLIFSIKIINNFGPILEISKNVIFNFFSIISPIFWGFLLAYILFRPTLLIQDYLEKGYKKIFKKNISTGINKTSRILSIFLIYIIIGALITLIINFVIPPIIDNLKILLSNIPKYQEQLAIWFQELINYLNANNADVPTGVELSQMFSNIMSNLTNSALGLLTNFLNGLTSFVVDFVFTLIFTFYFIKDKEILFGNFKKMKDVLLPKKVANVLTIFLKDLDEIVGKFIIGQIIATIVVGFVSAILMLLINHPFAILIGVVAGITNIIPLVGPIIGAFFAFILGVFTSFSLGVWGALLLILYQQVDGNFVQPKIVGDRIGLIPIWVLIVILIGGSYFGAIGMILSMPVAGLIRVYFNRYAEYKKRKACS